MADNSRGRYRGYTDARKEFDRRYWEKYVEVRVRMSPEEREVLRKRAASLGVSMNTYILGLIQADRPDSPALQPETEEPGADK